MKRLIIILFIYLFLNGITYGFEFSKIDTGYNEKLINEKTNLIYGKIEIKLNKLKNDDVDNLVKYYIKEFNKLIIDVKNQYNQGLIDKNTLIFYNFLFEDIIEKLKNYSQNTNNSNDDSFKINEFKRLFQSNQFIKDGKHLNFELVYSKNVSIFKIDDIKIKVTPLLSFSINNCRKFLNQDDIEMLKVFYVDYSSILKKNMISLNGYLVDINDGVNVIKKMYNLIGFHIFYLSYNNLEIEYLIKGKMRNGNQSREFGDLFEKVLFDFKIEKDEKKMLEGYNYYLENQDIVDWILNYDKQI